MRRRVSFPFIVLVAAAIAPAAARGADARAGEALYVGSERLANGGAPCLACHGIAAHGLAWKASFGPDLSTAAASYDAETLDALLADVPFPSMAPVYRAHALLASERAAISAFLVEAREAPLPADARLPLLAQAGAGALLVLGLLVVLYRRRMPPVKDALARARAGLGGQR